MTIKPESRRRMRDAGLNRTIRRWRPFCLTVCGPTSNLTTTTNTKKNDDRLILLFVGKCSGGEVCRTVQQNPFPLVCNRQSIKATLKSRLVQIIQNVASAFATTANFICCCVRWCPKAKFIIDQGRHGNMPLRNTTTKFFFIENAIQ